MNDFWRKFTRHRAALTGLIIFTVVLALAISADLISPYSPGSQSLARRLKPPLWEDELGNRYLLGTDHLGRDVLSRLIHGSRVSLTVGVASVLLGGGIGLLMGLLSGYFGGWLDTLIMRLADIQLSFPFLLLALALVSILGSSLWNVVLVLAVTSWITYAKVIRSAVLSLREKEFIEACRAIGATDLRTIIVHIIPNIVSSFVVIASFQVAALIIAESSLSYLGLGVPTIMPTWGGMLADGREYIRDAWWIEVFPGMMLMLTALSFNLLGDGLRDAMDTSIKEY
jgi:peptide/nickel transport system permease protein